jgi:hypothetical protein
MRAWPVRLRRRRWRPAPDRIGHRGRDQDRPGTGQQEQRRRNRGAGRRGYKSLPSNVSDCTFSNNKARANYYTIYNSVPTVFCTIKLHPLTVTVKGLTDAGLVLVNGSDRQTVTPNGGADVPVKMADIPEDGPYGVTILSQPGTSTTQTQTCTISGGSGNMTATGPGTTPVVTCGPKS